jgi:hypothetical protein
MVKTHLSNAIGTAALSAVLVLIALLPFLPGSYDPLAAPLSLMARTVGVLGLLLVPIGAVWHLRHRYALAVTALVVLTMVCVAVSLVALMSGGYALGAATLLAALGGLWRLKSRLEAEPRTATVYLVAVPPIVFLLQLTLVGRAVEFSRNRAIQSAAPLIADIERYRAARGVYPHSLLSVWEDYRPGVVGVERFHYERSGDAYNVVFEHVASNPATREFVVYNPLDQQVFTSHRMALLRHADQIEKWRGYFAVHPTQHPHWKYFWFD